MDLSIGSTVIYVCYYGYQHETRHLTRTCKANGIWDDVPSVCSRILIQFISLKNVAINVREYQSGKTNWQSRENKSREEEEKQNTNTTQYVLDTTMNKQTQIV